MSQHDPHRADAPAPIHRPGQPTGPTSSVENPVVAANRAPDRVVPSGFSRSEDAIYQEQWGAQQPTWATRGDAAPPPAWQLPPAPPSRTRVPAALPLEGQVYAQVLRPLKRRVGRWFLAWAIVIAFFLLGQAIAFALMMPAAIELFSDFSDEPTDVASAVSTLMASPWAFLGLNLSWAVMIPAAVLALAAYGDKAMGFAFSVAGRWRWNLVGRTAMVIAPIFAAYIAFTFLIDWSPEWRFQPDWVLVAIVLLTTPLQSSGEEFAFRGIVTQQLGSWMRNPWVASLVTGGAIALVFGFAHIGYPPLAILQVALVGFTCSMLTFRTGGLEAACVLHTANNVFIMLPLALMGMSPFATSPGEQEPPFWEQFAVFAACVTALGLSYVAVHLLSKHWQRRTEGAPGAETLLLPKQQQLFVVAPGYGAPGSVAPGGHAPSYGAPEHGAQQPHQQAWGQPQQQHGASWGPHPGQPHQQTWGQPPGSAPQAQQQAPWHPPQTQPSPQGETPRDER